MAAGEPSTRESILDALRDPANAAAWEVFYARYEPLIRRCVRSHRPRPGDEDDMTQEVLAKLFLKLPEYEYDPSKRFRGWLSVLVRNEVYDSWRRQRWSGGGGTSNADRLQTIPDPDDRGVLAHLIEVETGLEDERLLRAAINRVRPRVREARWRAFWMTTVEGRRAVDLAAGLGMTVGAIYVARHHVTKLIRAEVERLREEGPPPAAAPDGAPGEDDHDDA